MAKELRCRDVGVDCDYVARGETDEEVTQKAKEHGQTVHNMKEIPKEIVQKIQSAIRNV